MDNNYDLAYCNPYIASMVNPLQDGEFVVLQTIPRHDSYSVIRHSSSLSELQNYCDQENYMADYSHHSVFVYNAITGHLHKVLFDTDEPTIGEIFDEEWNL